MYEACSATSQKVLDAENHQYRIEVFGEADGGIRGILLCGSWYRHANSGIGA
jgi:hypothetical protein